MPFAPGTRVGPYEILSPIGAGGMGEVWKARDTRLNRQVAIKTSHAKFSERFEREARAIAALNHPNICQIYDVGPDYLVMEYVEGTPIAPVDTTRRLLDIAVQLSDGLAAAHAAKIIHRDLKPDNILITRDGRVKILDFGLAKTTAEIDNDDVTRSINLTGAGSTVGTIAYMSPEQARGNQNLTPQSDQFSLGLVLYELASGKRAFQRGSAAEVMTAIIREDYEPLPATVPAPLRWIVERLLAKEPADRYDSTRDVYRDLRQIRERLTEAASASGIQTASTTDVARQSQQSQPRSRVRLLLAGAAIGLLAAGVSWLVHPNDNTGQPRFLPMEVSWEDPSNYVWSPDGKAFAYSAGTEKDRHVFLRNLNAPAAVPLTRGNADLTPMGWSPDGKRVIVGGKNPRGDKPPRALFAVPVFGGEPELIMTLPELRDATISRDGKSLAIVPVQDDGSVAVYTASPVGSPLKLYTPAPFKTSAFINSPQTGFFPDGKSILLVLDVPGGRQAWKLPYPAGTGAPERMLKALPSNGGTPVFSWFPDGRHGILGLDDEAGMHTHLWSIGLHSGSRRQITNGASSEYMPALSPDGTKVLFEQGHTDYMIVSASLSDATVERVISSAIMTAMPAWAPHQAKLVYESSRDGSPAVWLRAEGWDRPIVTAAAFPPGTTSWFMTPALSPGADRLVFTRVDRDQQVHDWISSVSGGSPVRLTNTKDTIEVGGSWSPDGSKFIYGQIRDHVLSLMIVRTTGEAEPVTFRGDVETSLPEWSPDGQWIKFLQKPERGGWSIVSADGKTVRSYGEPDTIEMTFSADSRSLYGIRKDGDHRYLYSLDIATKGKKTIGDVGKDFTPQSNLTPGIRLSLAPDGKSIVYPAIRSSSSLWMLEGFDAPGWTDRLREILPW